MKKAFIIFFSSLNFTFGQSTLIDPLSINVPNVTTNQQNNLSSQQSGSLVFNSDTKSLNFNNGERWKSLNPSEYPNTQYFTLPQFLSSNNEILWIVPSNTQNIMVEIYSGGGCGNEYGGGCGGNYGVGLLNVIPNQQVYLKIGEGCNRLDYTFGGRDSYLRVNSNYFLVKGGGNFNGTTSWSPYSLDIPNSTGYAVSGSSGKCTQISYVYDGTNYHKRIEYGDGGSGPNNNNGGRGASLLQQVPNGGSAGYGATYGGFPSGGGGGTCCNGIVTGGDGLIIIHW